MKITFDPNNPEDVAAVQAFLGGTTETAAPAKPVSNGNISDSSEDRVDPNDIPTVDCHGMEWNPEIHAETKALNNDGSWKVRRGKTAEAKAAIADFEKQQVQETRAASEEPATPTGMPGVTMPSPEPEIPEPVIEFQQLVERFTGMMESGAIKDWSVAYQKAGVANADDLETNESLRRVLWNILDDVDDNGWDAVFAS